MAYAYPGDTPGGYYDENGVWHDYPDASTPPTVPTTAAPAPTTTTPPPAPDPTAPQPPTTDQPTSTIAPWTQTFTPAGWADLPPAPNVPNAPVPDLPIWKTPAPLDAPTPFTFTIGDALNSPEYNAIVQRGLQQEQGTAAARGTLNDSGTNKAISDYLVNAENAQLSNIWNQQFSAWQGNNAANKDTYLTNYQTQYVDPYQANYQRALDLNAPAIAQWQAQNTLAGLGYQGSLAATTARNQFNAQNAWDQYVNAQDLWKFNATNNLNPAA